MGTKGGEGMIDRQKLLWKLNERDYLHKLHRTIKEGLIGTLRQEYIMGKPALKPYEEHSKDVEQFVNMPTFHALVDMMTAQLLYATSEKFVHEICDTIDESKFTE